MIPEIRKRRRRKAGIISINQMATTPKRRKKQRRDRTMRRRKSVSVGIYKVMPGTQVKARIKSSLSGLFVSIRIPALHSALSTLNRRDSYIVVSDSLQLNDHYRYVTFLYSEAATRATIKSYPISQFKSTF